MKRTLAIFLALLLIIIWLLTACNKEGGTIENDQDSFFSSDAESEILTLIDKFMKAVEKGNTKAYIKCLDPDVQTLIESGVNSLGNALGIDNAYGVSLSASTLLSAAFEDSSEIEVDFERGDIKSSSIDEDYASYYIEYSVKVESTYLDEPIEGACTVEFKLVQKEGAWYIQSMSEISDEVNTEILAGGLNILSGTSFSDGVAFVNYLNKEGNRECAAIDKTGKVLFIADDIYKSGYDYCYENGILVIDNLIYDKTGKIIASPEMSGYDELLTRNRNGYVLAMKKEESFSGDKYYIGVLDNKGEWAHPLSEEHPIVKAFQQENVDIDELYISAKYDYLSDTTLKIDIGWSVEKYYNIVLNELTDEYSHYVTDNYNLYQCDTAGNWTLILENVDIDYTFEDVFIGTEIEWEGNKVIKKGQKIFDYHGDVLTDLSDYQLDSLFSNHGPGEYYFNEHLLISVDNGSGAQYVCLFNKVGEPAFEPIRVGSRNDDYFPLDENGFVYELYDENTYSTIYKLYDYNGNVTEYTDIVKFGGFSEGLAVVENTAGQVYYINAQGEIVIK